MQPHLVPGVHGRPRLRWDWRRRAGVVGHFRFLFKGKRFCRRKILSEAFVGEGFFFYSCLSSGQSYHDDGSGVGITSIKLFGNRVVAARLTGAVDIFILEPANCKTHQNHYRSK